MANPVMDLVLDVEEKYGSSTVSSKQQLINHLDSLGYLNLLSITAHNSETELEKAYQQYYLELKASGLLKSSDLEQTETIFGADSRTKLLELAIDIDEGLRFKSLPSFGTRNLKSRIIHYRLNLLGLYAQEVNAPYSSLSYVALAKLGSYITKPNLTAINMVADLQEFTNQYLKVNGYQHCLTVFDTPDDFNVDEYPDYSGKFKRTLKRNLKKHQDVFNELDDNLFLKNDDKVNEQYLQKLMNSEFNDFTLRLIQIHQWMSGFYHGTIDDYFGPVSIKSLTNIIDSYVEAHNDNVKLEEVLVKIKGDIFLFNALFFLEHYKEESYAQDRTIETLNTINSAYVKASNADKLTFEENLHVEISSLNRKPDRDWQPFSSTRKVFTGIKTFFKKIFKFARKIFKWIVDKIDKFADFIKSFIRNLYEYIKLAVQHFINGIKFLVGKLPIITTNEDGSHSYSNFDIDKDALNIFCSNSPSHINEHLLVANKQVKSMGFSLAVVSLIYGLLRTALAGATVILMPVFLLKLAKSFKIVIDKYKLIVTI